MHGPNDLPRMLTIAEAAAALRCSPRTIREAIDSGTLRGIKPLGRWLVFEDSVSAILGEKPERAGKQSARDLRRALAAMESLGVELSTDYISGKVDTK